MGAKWDGGGPVAAVGRFYVEAAAGATTVLKESAGGGAAGDALDWVWIFPQTVTPGALSIEDDGSPIWVWPAGMTLGDTRPFFVPLNLASLNGAWSIVAGADVTALAGGAFS